MGSLFWKMFFGAWITAVVMVMAAVFITHFAQFGDPQQKDRWESVTLFREVTRNLRMTRRHGAEHFRQWLESQPVDIQQRIFAINRDGREILQRPLPVALAPVFSALNKRNREVHTLVDNQPTIGFFMRQRGGNSWRVAFIAEKNRTELLLQFLLRSFWPNLLLTTLISGLACFWLARYLSRPLNNLRTATRRVAAGELSYRVAPTLGGHSNELSELAQDFDSMTAQLQQAMSEQRRLIKDVSHELRSPLARLQVALAIARQKKVHILDTELDKIAKAAGYLEDIITDILSLPASGSDLRPLDDVVEINGLIAALTLDLDDEAKAKKVRFVVEPWSQEILVATRGSSLTAALENILYNGIKYTPANGNIRVQIQRRDQHCHIAVTDSGSGIANEALQAIFRPFYRIDEARTRQSGGTGLGLAIAQRSIVNHGGSISAFNATDAGLCVQIELPLLQQDY